MIHPYVVLWCEPNLTRRVYRLLHYQAGIVDLLRLFEMETLPMRPLCRPFKAYRLLENGSMPPNLETTK